MVSTAKTDVPVMPVTPASRKATKIVERRFFMGGPFKSLMAKIAKVVGEPCRSGRIRPDRFRCRSRCYERFGLRLDRRERVARAVLGELAGAGEREVRAADHHLLGDH